jgi:hypothetical protein
MHKNYLEFIDAYYYLIIVTYFVNLFGILKVILYVTKVYRLIELVAYHYQIVERSLESYYRRN